MMLKVVAVTLLMASVVHTELAMSSESDNPSATAQDPAARQAGDLARQALAAQLKVAIDGVMINSIEPRTWSDSSMGCGKAGTVAMQVITDGYAVSLVAQGRPYRVHVSGSQVIVCDRRVLLRDETRRPGNARGLDVMIDKARQDLAQRLGADPAKIRLYGTHPQQWQDNGLECPRAGEEIVAKPVNGYRLSFSYQSRIYTYHSDLIDVRACPAIEGQ